MAKPKPAPASGEDPKSDYYAKKASLGWAQGEMARFYARAVPEDIESLVRLIDPQRRSEAMRIINQLIMHARGEAEFGMPSPVEKMLTKLKTEHARSENPQQAKQRQRRERLWPYVKAKAAEFPLESPAKIITLLRKGKGFREQFDAIAARRTLDADAAALLKEFRQT